MMRHVIIGASAAGLAAAAELRQADPDGTITVISAERHIYSRCMLHHFLAGHRDEKSLAFVDEDFFKSNSVDWLSGRKATALDCDRRVVSLDTGESLRYDKLLIASGAMSTIPPVPGLREASKVWTLRTLDDARELNTVAVPGTRAVIIGAGLVGMDAAVALLERGVSVTLVEMASRILSIQLDAYAAERYAERLRQAGAAVVVNAKVDKATYGDDGSISSICLQDGTCLPCDFCVVAAGVSPNIGFISDKRLLTNNGRAVSVDRHCRTMAPDVYAAGDVTYLAPIWPEAVRQGRVAGINMGGGDASLPEIDWAWTNSMNFFGLPTVSYGRTNITDPLFTEEIYQNGDVYKKIIHKDGKIFGALFQGDIDNCGAYLRLVKEGIPMPSPRPSVFSISYADYFRQAANGEFL